MVPRYLYPLHLKMYHIVNVHFVVRKAGISMATNKMYRSVIPYIRDILPVKRLALIPCNRTISTSALRRSLEQTSLGPAPDEFPIITTPASEAQLGAHTTPNRSLQSANPAIKRRRLNAQPSTNHTRTAGTVVGAGKMAKTVKILFVRQHWNRYLRKVSLSPLLSCYHVRICARSCRADLLASISTSAFPTIFSRTMKTARSSKAMLSPSAPNAIHDMSHMRWSQLSRHSRKTSMSGDPCIHDPNICKITQHIKRRSTIGNSSG